MRSLPLLAFALAAGCGAGSPPPTRPPAKTNVEPVDAGAPAPIVSASVTPAPNPSDVPFDPPPQASAQPPIPDGVPADEASQPWNRKPSASEVKACSAKGGKLQPVCMSGAIECVIRFKDAGKRCTDKKDCTGDCLYEGDGAPTSNAVGVCQRTSDPCGCKTPIHHGKADVGICTD